VIGLDARLAGGIEAGRRVACAAEASLAGIGGMASLAGAMSSWNGWYGRCEYWWVGIPGGI